MRRRKLKSIVLASFLAGGASLAYFELPKLFNVEYAGGNSSVAKSPEQIVAIAPVSHIPTPDRVKSIYMSQCAAGTPSFRDKLVDLIDATELNAVVIDIRDFSGKISFPTADPVLHDMVSSQCGAHDMKEFVQKLHAKNIYVIGRITTFQNPYYTKIHPEEAVQKKGGGVWKDYKGLSFVDVSAKPYWGTVVELGKVAYEDIGFDELNFDYVRFPSDGLMSQAVYSWDGGKSKAEALEEFFKYLHDHLKPLGVTLSADLFGMSATNTDDLGIGQVLESALPYFDFIDPMVYPSHYPPTWGGFQNPAIHPYDVVKIAMDKAVLRAAAAGENIRKIRPWLQDFDMGATYTADMVRAQMKATNDAGLNSWMLWDAGNTYTAEALEKE